MGEGHSKLAVKTLVYFRCAFNTSSSEEVRVVGSAPELGSWDVKKGIKLDQQSTSSCWTSCGISLPLGVQVEYKYAVCSCATGDLVEWEEFEGNRSVIPTGRRHILEDDDGAFRLEGAGLAPSSDPELHSAPTGERTVLEKSSNSLPKTSSIKGLLPESTCELTSQDTVFVVFRSLPLTVELDAETKEWKVIEPRSNQSAALPSLLHHFTKEEVTERYKYKVRFIGLPGVHVKEESEKRKITEALAKHSCIPVFVDKEVVEQHLAFSINFLWPVFHNMKTFDTSLGEEWSSSSSQTFDESKWKSYQALNNAFAEVIEAKGNAETLVWVHDYQLLLVPRYVYLRRPSWCLGFFLHCSFPSSEVLLCLPNREDILQSMLSSKLVTFQIFDYMRNFMSCCSALLGAQHSFQKGGILQVEHDSTSVVVTADHFVLPYARVLEQIDSDDVQFRARKIRERFKGKIIVGSHDKCDRFAGLTLKFRIFHKFLSEYTYYQGKIVLVQYVSSQTDNGAEDTATLFKDLEKMAAEINHTFGQADEPPVVTVCAEDVDQFAVLQAIDVLLDTSINDGLNLTPFMFYTAHAVDRKGAVILSEFCGSCSALTGVFKVNPWSPSAVMTALDEALSLEPSQQAARFDQDHSYVSTQTLLEWVNQNLSELKNVQHLANKPHQVPGFDASLRRSLEDNEFQHLSLDAVVADYRRAKTRVLLLDYEGTMAAKAGWSIQAGTRMALKRQGHDPDGHVLHCLQTLANDRSNTVVVASGRDPDCVDRWFGQVHGLGLCAEHGYYWVLPGNLQSKGGSTNEEARWNSMTTEGDETQEWKEIAKELIQLYVKRVQGSILECKGSAITWNYRGVGVVSELALELARFLNPDHPNGVLHGYPVKVVCGKGYVEVKRADVDKGVAVERVLKELQQQFQVPVEFVLCIGDDRSDEDMFEAVNKFYEAALHMESQSPTTLSPVLSPVPFSSRKRVSGFADVEKDTASSTAVLPEMKNQNQRGCVLNAPETSGLWRKRSVDTDDVGGVSARLSKTTESFKYYTVTVGRKPSKAKYFAKDVEEVSALLTKLTSETVVSAFSRYSSMPSLADPTERSDSSDDECSHTLAEDAVKKCRTDTIT